MGRRPTARDAATQRTRKTTPATPNGTPSTHPQRGRAGRSQQDTTPSISSSGPVTRVLPSSEIRQTLRSPPIGNLSSVRPVASSTTARSKSRCGSKGHQGPSQRFSRLCPASGSRTRSTTKRPSGVKKTTGSICSPFPRERGTCTLPVLVSRTSMRSKLVISAKKRGSGVIVGRQERCSKPADVGRKGNTSAGSGTCLKGSAGRCRSHRRFPVVKSNTTNAAGPPTDAMWRESGEMAKSGLGK